MKAQKPAKGVLVMNDWGSSMMFKAVCQCGDDEHSHTIDVDADDGNVSVTIYTTQKTKWWKLNRWQKMWTLLTKGYLEFETDLIMDKQSALNYAETLKQAVSDCEKFEAERKAKFAKKQEESK